MNIQIKLSPDRLVPTCILLAVELKILHSSNKEFGEELMKKTGKKKLNKNNKHTTYFVLKSVYMKLVNSLYQNK